MYANEPNESDKRERERERLSGGPGPVSPLGGGTATAERTRRTEDGGQRRGRAGERESGQHQSVLEGASARGAPAWNSNRGKEEVLSALPAERCLNVANFSSFQICRI